VSHDLPSLVAARGFNLLPKPVRDSMKSWFVRNHESGKSLLQIEWHEPQTPFVLIKSALSHTEMRSQNAQRQVRL